jgi:hypothetical protein
MHEKWRNFVESLKFLRAILAPIVLTSLFCAAFTAISGFNPFFGLIFYPVGLLGMLMTLDAL